MVPHHVVNALTACAKVYETGGWMLFMVTSDSIFHLPTSDI
jgi:hypothetical protein